VPVIGVAQIRAGPRALRAAPREPRAARRFRRGGVRRLRGLLRYVDGDYNDAATFQAIKRELGQAQRPAHYLAIPPALFGTVSSSSRRIGCTPARASSSKSRSGTTCRRRATLNAILLVASTRTHLPHRPLSRQAAGAQHGVLPLRERVSRGVLEPQVREERADHDGGEFGIQGRGAFYDQIGTVRDVIQNHLFQVLANLAMEPPARNDSESMRDEKVKVLKSIPPIETKDIVRGPVRGLSPGARCCAPIHAARLSRR
jgi:glucose-6-phosphate 1-dehydrogenase